MRFSLGKVAKGIVAGGLAVAAASSFAATDGFTGFTSTGTLDITLNVTDEVRISNLQDIDLGTFGGTDASGFSPACVYRNATGNYQITASGDGAASAFELSDLLGGTATVPYSVTWDDGSASGAQSLASGVALTGLTGADTSSDTCGTTGNNGTVVVTVTAASAAALPAGDYAGTLTLVVAPE